MSLTELPFALAGLALSACILYSLGHVLFTPAERWQTARRNRLAWLALQLLLPGLGGLVYFFAVRPDIDQAGRDRPADAR